MEKINKKNTTDVKETVIPGYTSYLQVRTQPSRMISNVLTTITYFGYRKHIHVVM